MRPAWIAPASRLIADNGELSTEEHGAGVVITLGTAFSVAGHLAVGRLVRVLQGHA